MKTNHELEYGKHKIPYTLIRKNVKNININLKPTLIIEVSASKETPEEKIHAFVKKKASWILKNTAYFKRTIPELKHEKEYVSGETFKYLGRQYRLKVIKSNGETVKCKRGFLNLYVKDVKDISSKSRLIKQWYKDKTIKIFNQSLENVYRLISKYDVNKPEIILRPMKARWGSCIISKNKILLNTELIDAPKFCIEYVILHELIHFKYQNHDKNFHKLMDSLMPDWKKRKEILDVEVVKNL